MEKFKPQNSREVTEIENLCLNCKEYVKNDNPCMKLLDSILHDKDHILFPSEFVLKDGKGTCIKYNAINDKSGQLSLF